MEGLFRAGQAFRGIFLSANKIIAACVQNDAQGLGLVVKRVGVDQRVDQLDLGSAKRARPSETSQSSFLPWATVMATGRPSS